MMIFPEPLLILGKGEGMADRSGNWVGILCGMGAGALWGLVFLAPELVRAFGPLELTLGRYLSYGAM